MGTLTELVRFAMQRKKLFLVPLFVVLALFGLLMTFAGGSAVAPFIYTLF